jgi:hypothetical protein
MNAARASRHLSLRSWRRRGFDMPAPSAVKWAVLERYGFPQGEWIETGTYLGDTTAVLARKARHVWSIEPEPTLARNAVARFANAGQVTIVNGTSEDRLQELLDAVTGDSVSFWLDGHYSAGVTFQGEKDTPIRQELELIEKRLPDWRSVAVMVDDVRCFDPSDPLFTSYPPREWLVDWAVRNGLSWTIEHDIFVARR